MASAASHVNLQTGFTIILNLLLMFHLLIVNSTSLYPVGFVFTCVIKTRLLFLGFCSWYLASSVFLCQLFLLWDFDLGVCLFIQLVRLRNLQTHR